MKKLVPTVQEIPYQDPLKIFAQFANKPWSMLLHSARTSDEQGRYSYIAVDPFMTFTIKNDQTNPFEKLREYIKNYSLTSLPDLPPFQGGVVGYFGYELGRYLEKLPVAKIDDLKFSDMALGFYDLVIAFDHKQNKTWIFASTQERLNFLLQQLENIEELPPIAVENIAESQITSNFTAKNYQSAVQKVRDYIYAGDIFQANISQRFSSLLAENFSAFDLYRRLCANNPAPFASYLKCGDTTIVSASPERFVKLTAGEIETRPIKGTRPRGIDEKTDKLLAHELQTSEKDRAENIMIVDLMRNDLSRVCEPYSVNVPQLCGLESFATVHHLVSVVTGKLKENLTAIDLLKATFPGGSITGAPKIRAMEIIAEIEPTVRGPYCGCIGYIGFDGNMDSAITIRTFAIKNNIVTFQVGGGIVADSDPVAEYEETLHKASALFRALVG